MFVRPRSPMHQPLCQRHTVTMTFDCINLKSTPRLTILQFQCRHVAWLDLTFLSLAWPQCRPGFNHQLCNYGRSYNNALNLCVMLSTMCVSSLLFFLLYASQNSCGLRTSNITCNPPVHLYSFQYSLFIIKTCLHL